MPARRRNPFVVAAALALGLTLSGCESLEMPVDWFNTKKPLPGERKAVFPEGVPGVPQGVPPELVQGYQPPSEPPPVVQAEEKPKAQDKPKPRPKKVATPVRPAIAVQPAAPVDEPPSPWPAPRQTASQPAPPQSQSVFPDPPPPSR